MPIKATQLRQNLYQLLDQVLAEGKPLEIERGGQILKIIPAQSVSKFDLLEDKQSIIGDPEDLLGLDWSEYWSETKTKTTPKKKTTKKRK